MPVFNFLAGRKVAIDASMSLYQFLIAVRADGAQLVGSDGETTRCVCVCVCGCETHARTSPSHLLQPFDGVFLSHNSDDRTWNQACVRPHNDYTVCSVYVE